MVTALVVAGLAAILPALPSQAEEPVGKAAPLSVDKSPKQANGPDDGKTYPVSKFVLRYGNKHPDLPPIEEVMAVEVELGKLADAYVAPRPGVEAVTVKLADVPGLPVHRFYESAIRTVNLAIVRFFNEQKIIGVFVTIDPEALDLETGKDLRKKGDTALREVIWVGVVTKVRTIASGERVPDDERIDSPVHRRIKDRSPIQPGREGKVGRTALIRKDLLDDYVFRLNRHPGRRVDVALSSAGKTGDVCLDYLVSENKPWLAYAQLTNTGTKQTGKWRERFGVIHNQLTGNDDILTVDYSTTRFHTTHAVMGSYEAPVGRCDWLRWRVYGSYSEYSASDVGLSSQEFSGRDVTASAELIATVQYRQLFLDVMGGARWRRIHVSDSLVGSKAREDFLIPHVALRLTRKTDLATTAAMIRLETNCPSLAGTSGDGIRNLGRIDAAPRWWLIRWDLNQSFYLEPLLNREAWADGSTPKSSTLAHEMMFAFRGQRSLGYRLIAQEEDVVGGFYSVRGYHESEVAGDSAMVATAEYRFHLPRALPIQRDTKKVMILGRPFRYAPPSVYGRPDWDLIFRTFFDVGRTTIRGQLASEHDQTLVGWGLGVELQLYQNVIVRTDWGQALRDVRGGGTRAGDHRFHISITLIY